MKSLTLLLLTLLICTSCTDADKSLLRIETEVLNYIEADDYFTDFDKDWEKSK